VPTVQVEKSIRGLLDESFDAMDVFTDKIEMVRAGGFGFARQDASPITTNCRLES